jgi:hypothetical protein
MGVLSSWAMLAITHHIIVLASAARTNAANNPFELYELIGDDLVICEHSIKGEYSKLMSSLGVEVSEMKTHISMRTLTFEYAKRYLVRGIETSPLPCRLFKTIVHQSGAGLSGLFYDI